MKTDSGFTLVELIVVIAIIGIISTIGISSFTNYIKIAQDAVRKSDLLQIKKALDAYYALYGSYPSTIISSNRYYFGVSINGGLRAESGSNAYIPGLTPTFLEKLPVDPKKDKNGWSGYLYMSDGVNYKLLAHTNGPEFYPKSGEPFYDPNRPGWSWMLCSAEPACSSW